MKNIVKITLLMIALILSFKTNNMAFAENENYVKVIYSTINIYSNPDIDTSTILCAKTYGEKLKLISTEKVQGEDGFLYFNIELTDVAEADKGYVFCSQVLDVNLSSPIKDLDHNGSVNKEATVYVKEENSFVSTSVKLAPNQKIKILDGYDSNTQFTRIQYKDTNGEIITAYVKTADIKTSGISRGTIGAIIIIITTVSLVLVLFGIKGKRKKQ